MDRFTLMETFAAVAKAESFTAAARTLGVTRALVSKRIQDLETGLGVKLLNRDTHRVSMTAGGEEYYESCRRLLGELRELEERVQARRNAPVGALRILCSKTFGERMLGPIVTDFCLAHPTVSIHLTIGDRALAALGLDLMSGGFDLAIRTLPVQDSALIARPVATLPRVLVASPAYLEAHKPPRGPADLLQHNCLDFGGGAERRWDFAGPEGSETVRISGSLSANSSAVLREAALAGLGIASLSDFIVTEDLRSGALVRVLAGYAMPERKLYVVYQRDRQRPLRMRLFVEFLSRRLKTAERSPPAARRRPSATQERR